MTVWKVKGRGRIDIENPKPGRRAGQIHYQDKFNNKYYYQHKNNIFTVDVKGTKPAPKRIQNLLQEKGFMKGIKKGLNYLGEK